LREWGSIEEAKIPPVILNKHCPLCPLLKECEAKAKELDHLSLLDNISKLKYLKDIKGREFLLSISYRTYTDLGNNGRDPGIFRH
jgi:hypothetical protein